MKKRKRSHKPRRTWIRLAYCFFTVTLMIGVGITMKIGLERSAGRIAYESLRQTVRTNVSVETEPNREELASEQEPDRLETGDEADNRFTGEKMGDDAAPSSNEYNRAYGTALAETLPEGRQIKKDTIPEESLPTDTKPAEPLPAESLTDKATPAAVPTDNEKNPITTPIIEKKQRITMNDATMREICADAVAWIVCEGTELDYPVMQGEDNEYYLNHLYNGTVNGSGSLFVDCRNSGDFSDRNTIIYGHHMNNGTMFARIVEYKSQVVYEARPEMLLYTPQGDYLVKLFAGTVENGDEQFAEFNFQNEDEFQSYVSILKQNSTFASDVEPQPGDRIITLCTCTYDFVNARYAVYGVLVPIME